jgi:uncharacterized protein YjbI with pentapeptide repeats
MFVKQGDVQTVIHAYNALYPEELIERYKRGERDFRGINLFRAELEQIIAKRFAMGQHIELPHASEDFNPLWEDYRSYNFDDAKFDWDSDGYFIPEEFEDILPMRDLSNADLEGINLSGSYLYRVKLDNANLSNAIIRKAQVFDAEWNGVDLNHSDLRRTWFHDVKMTNSNIYMSRLNRTRFLSCNLQGADLRRAKLRKTWLVNSNLSNAKLNKAHFDQTILTNSNLLNVDFDQVDFNNSILYEITLNKNQQMGFLKAMHIREASPSCAR